jgi:RimJ/RimL family protein N-acetyltransferase
MFERRAAQSETFGGLNPRKRGLVTFRQLSAPDAEAIARWRYADEYSVYDISDETRESSVQYMTTSGNRFFGAYEGEELVGFCSVGSDGQVAGGVYDGSAVDIGAGMRPDLVGRHGGGKFLRSIIEFVGSEIGGGSLRATIASWNERALRAAKAVGFIPQITFVRSDGKQFIVLVRAGSNTAATPPNTPLRPTAEKRGG